MESVSLKAQVREQVGRKNANSLRKEGQIPCVLYGGDENFHFSIDEREAKNVVYTPKFLISEINLDGQVKRAILKDLTFHPVTDKVLHIDFQELVPGRLVRTEIPVQVTGFAEGVKAGGKLEVNVRKLNVRALSEKLVDSIPIDVTPLQMGKSFKVRDLEPVEGIEVLNSPGIPIAQVIIPRAMRSAASKAGAEGEDAETAEE